MLNVTLLQSYIVTFLTYFLQGNPAIPLFAGQALRVIVQAMPAIPFFSQPPNPPCLRRASTYPRPPPFPGRAPTDFGPQPSRSQVFLVSPTHQRVGDDLLRLARCPLRRYPRGLTRRQPKKSHDSPEGRKLVNHTKTLTEGGLRPVVSWSLS